MGKTYVVGDIQACFDGLQALLKKVGFKEKSDRLLAVGDLIGRGPQALETLRFLYGLGKRFDCVLGNHDLHFLAVSQGIKKPKPRDNYQALLADKHLDRYVQWLRCKPLAQIPEPGTFLCHAGLYPFWSEKKGLLLAREVENKLQSKHWHSLLEYMYGSEECTWSDKLSGLSRLKFIVDAFTRMRFVDKNGTLNLTVKTMPEEAPIGYMPWFKHPNLKVKSQLLFGHWAALQGKTGLKNVISLDTGYIWGGKMTVIELSSMEAFAVANKSSSGC